MHIYYTGTGESLFDMDGSESNFLPARESDWYRSEAYINLLIRGRIIVDPYIFFFVTVIDPYLVINWMA
jgi:hypothetical protein